MSERDEQRLEDILRAIDSILRHRPESAADFRDNEPLQSHVKLKLQVIGEAASRLSPQTRAVASEIPWRKIVGMRNILVHEYEGVDVDIVWGVVPELPALRDHVEELLESLRAEGSP